MYELNIASRRRSGVDIVDIDGPSVGRLGVAHCPPYSKETEIVLTLRMYAMSNRRVPTPTCILGLMLLTSPGKVSGTETIIALSSTLGYIRA
jgi:hypothetical protein